MALAKYAEEIREEIDERMAMREYTFTQEHKSRQNAMGTATTQSGQKERDDEFKAMFSGESNFIW